MEGGDHDGEFRELLRHLLRDAGDWPGKAAEAIVAYGSKHAEPLQQLLRVPSLPSHQAAAPPPRSSPRTDLTAEPSRPRDPKQQGGDPRGSLAPPLD